MNIKIRSFNRQQAPKPNLTSLEIDKVNKWVSESEKTPLCLEIGAGAGLHAIQWAKDNCSERLIAIEQTHERASKLKQRVKNHSLENILPIQSDAMLFIPHYILENCIKDIFILYPNPNPKEKDKNQRWVNMPAMKNILATLKINGKLTLATNIENYANEASSGFQEQWQLNLLESKASPFSFNPRTHFEKKYLERKNTCYNLVFGKEKNHQ
ncbi:MAG: SAM-dependent methyltransferase [Bdellovibrionaceae bacterium]|jgi:tRNA (guanine-N7-)-methyltransferase|nr:SAM-dependent methyltransferase [Pseudobdellovibrionaceae bacterium]